MHIPMDLILERMYYLHPEIQLQDRGVWVKGVKLLPGEWEGISCDYLYLCSAGDAFPPETDAILAVVCPGAVPDRLPRAHILLRTQVPFSDIFNELLGLQLLLQEWDLKLSLSVSEGRGIQHLLDLSEPVLGNPIVVADPACKCIAVTTSFDSDDPLFSQWLTQGYLSEENFEILKQSEVYMGANLYSGQSVVLPTSPVKPYVTVFTPVLSQDRSHVCYEIAMEFCNTPYSEGLVQLYGYLVEKLLVYLQEETQTAGPQTRYDYFLFDVLEGRCGSPQELEERARCFLGPEPEGLHVLTLWQAENSDRYRKHAIYELRGLFPQAQPVLYQDKLVLLARLGGIQPGGRPALKRLEEFLDSEDAFAGISDPIHSCHEIWRAFHRQSLPAIELGRALRAGGERETGRLFWYADYRLYRMIEAAHESLPVEELIHPLVIQLLRYDEVHRTAYWSALCTYLRLERSFTETARALHLHRNTVIYQIHRMEELFQLDLADQELRLQLLVSERILQLYPQAVQTTEKPSSGPA